VTADLWTPDAPPVDWADLDSETATGPSLFTRYRASQLADMTDTFTWLIQGALAKPTYGQLAGEMKSLKSYVGLFLALGLASGKTVFDTFTPPEPQPVMAYVGEGGRIPFQRRLRRVADAMDIDLTTVPLETTFDVSPIESPTFRLSLARDLEEVQPGLVWIDPYYAYHGTQTKASSLHEEGALLSGLSSRCLAAGASLLVNNHFNQSGTGTGLKRITMAGSGEWADSWILLAHRSDPDVENGRFHLDMSIGSRQWGGTAWELDLDIGRFNVDTGQHDGEITWALRRPAAANANRESDLFAVVLDVLEEHPWQLTKAKLVEAVGGKATVARGLIDALVQDRRIKAERLPRLEGTRHVNRVLYALADEPRPDHGTALDGVAS
jgi:hypothetical protein